MAANRYGRIYHSDSHFINLRFPSADARRKYAEEFERYHASHDHDGEVPRFEDTPAATIGNMEANRVHDAHSVSIDGYATYEIESYHNPDRWNSYDRSRYRPPTCCVPPTISINRTFIDSSELTRHELSEIFMDMPDEDFQNLLASVEKEGFKDPIIRMIDAQVLDGWHRYRAAKELNLLRKLVFQQWKEDQEGSPEAFVLARNLERRHLTPGQRSSIVVSFNQRYGMGRPSAESPSNDGLKSREELAKEANVGTATIDRAVKVEKAGRSDEVISGKKTQGEIITEETIKSLWEQVNPAISDWKKARDGVGYASKTMFIKAALRWEGLESHTVVDVKVLKILLDLLTTQETNVLEELIRKQLDGKSLWDDWDDDASAAETEQPKQTAEEREANAERKRKEGIVKRLWDLRIQVAREYAGDTDTELNQHLTLPDLEKGFAKCEDHEYCADAFQSAMHRTSATSFNICLEKTLASDVSLEDLDREFKAMSTYSADVFQWERHAWIQGLIEAKKAKADKAAAKAEPELDTDEDEDEISAETRKDRVRAELEAYWLAHRSWDGLDTSLFTQQYAIIAGTIFAMQKEIEAEHPDMEALWDAFNKRLPKWKAKYADSGYKENNLVQGATEAELFDALRSYRHSDHTGPVTAEEIKDVTDLMKKQSYPYARHLRNLLRDKQAEGLITDVDRCYAENQLQIIRNAMSPLLDRLGVEGMAQHDKETLTADVHDVFLEYENVPTESEIIVALLDVIDGILASEISDGRFDTLDNEVLCPDDEADRQEMNSELVTEVEE